jgi:polyhydroxyalkanoate synthesis regulator phasin
MPQNDGLKRYLEAGLALSQITRARAEELVRELIQAGEVETSRAQDWVEDLVKMSRDRSDALLASVRTEVRAQLDDLGIANMDDLARRVAEILGRAESAARRAATYGPGRGRATTRPAARTAPARKAPARKAPAKKAPAKKAPTRSANARATTVKKASARKVPTKKAAGTATATKKAGARASTSARTRR